VLAPIEEAPVKLLRPEGVPTFVPRIEAEQPDTAGDSKRADPAQIVRSAPAPVALDARRATTRAPEPIPVEPVRTAVRKEPAPAAALPEADDSLDTAQGELVIAASQEVIATPPARRGQLVDLATVDVEPVPIRRDLPRYTRKARRQDREGLIVMKLLIIENGRIAHAELVEEIPGSDLGDAAIEATRTWQFTPARKDGVPVRVWKNVRVHFALSTRGKAIVRIEE
jgi:protein TonB